MITAVEMSDSDSVIPHIKICSYRKCILLRTDVSDLILPHVYDDSTELVTFYNLVPWHKTSCLALVFCLNNDCKPRKTV